MSAWESSERAEHWAGERVLSSFWRFRWLLLAAALVGAAIGYGVSSLQSPVYAATARVILSDTGGDPIGTARTTIRDPSRYVRNQAEVMSSPVVAGVAAEQLGVSAAAVAGAVDAEPADGVDVVLVRARRGDRNEAADFANAVADAYVTVKTGEAQSEAAAAIATLDELRLGFESELREIEAALSADPDDVALRAQRDSIVAEIVSLNDQIDSIAVSAALTGSGVDLIEQALAPRVAVSPRPMRSALAAGAVALLIAAGFAWWRSVGRPIIVDSHDPAPLLRAPLLGEVPVAERASADNLRPYAPDSPAGEAYSFIFSGLAPHLEEKPSLMVAVTSPTPQQGKTTAVVNLGAAGVATGVSVLMVDADERARGLSSGLGEDQTSGLTDLGGGRTGVDELTVPVAWDDVASGNGSLVLMPAGTRLPGGTPAAFFRRADFRKAMSQLSNSAELVIVDTPPLLAVPEVTDIVREVDGVVLVLEPGIPLDVVEDARQRLETAQTPVLGYLLNRSRTRLDMYGYGYGHGRSRQAGLLQRVRRLFRRS